MDLYTAGFPCQPFSSAGKVQGFNDEQGRGTVVFDCMKYIETCKPRMFLLENVANLTTIADAECFAVIDGMLKAIAGSAYNVLRAQSWQP